jgi:hypothetical protein
MTPEERAKRADVDCWNSTHRGPGPCPVCVASAIRSAEDDALEKAAATLDKANEVCGDHHGICLFCAQRRRDARVIRSLKSQQEGR